ncbi:MAG: redoxin domain-containing protein [Bacteroidales bacterium]|nr:redoxin domain-containing protein [Bacteroidales bacterium]
MILSHHFFNGYYSKLILLLLVLQANTAYPQNFLSGEIQSCSNQFVSIYRMKGEKRYLIDSVATDENGKFRYELPSALQPGMLLLLDEKGKKLKFVYDRHDIQFSLEDMDRLQTIQFIGSDENEIWFRYLKLRDESNLKLKLLGQLLDAYPQQTAYYKRSEKEYNNLQNNYLSFIKRVNKHHGNSYVYSLIRTDFPTVVPVQRKLTDKKEFLIEHFLDSVDFTDTLLLNSDILTKKMVDFVALFQRDELTINEVQIEFNKALDQILVRAAEKESMYIFVLEFFIEGFTEMGLSTVTDYLSGLPHYKTDCLTQETMLKIEKLVEPFRNVQIGAIAPPINCNLLDGKPFSLNQVNSKSTIIVFWSVHCPFCLELLPKLKTLKLQHPEIEIVSIIVGKQRDDVEMFIKQEKLDWFHVFDGLNWKSPITDAYKVYGTPTLFLLNEKHQIIAKPMTFQELDTIIKN